MPCGLEIAAIFPDTQHSIVWVSKPFGRLKILIENLSVPPAGQQESRNHDQTELWQALGGRVSSFPMHSLEEIA